MRGVLVRADGTEMPVRFRPHRTIPHAFVPVLESGETAIYTTADRLTMLDSLGTPWLIPRVPIYPN